MQANIERDAKIFLEDGESHCQIICIWQRGADALIDQYQALSRRLRSLPRGDKLEIMVVTKEELMKKFMVKEEAVETTEQINAICKNSSQLIPNKEIHLYIDECWITVRKVFQAHITFVSESY